MTRPVMTDNPDLTILKQICEEYIEFISGIDYYEDNDYSHLIYEVVMSTLYPNQNVWDFINRQTS